MIHTAHLLLRPMTMDDLDDFVALHAEPEVERFMLPLGREQAIERLRFDERQWAERGHGLLAIHERAGSQFVGRVSLRYWPQFDETELGWVLHRSAWGHGFATEAAGACAAWGFANLDVLYLTAMIRPDNARSIRVAVRLGMAELRRDLLWSEPVLVYSLRRGP
jgi:RimJ/RimL family protein N-acetyltransferase